MGVLSPKEVRGRPDRGAVLLGERARLLGLSRQGRVSANGACRLYEARGGWLALNLPREADHEMLPALLGEAGVTIAGLAARLARLDRDSVVARGRELGLAIAADACAAAGPPLVIDLSGLWAGPLAGSLLAMAGARVIKVEGRGRPDGARGGNARFFDLLNAGKRSVVLDFADRADVAMLHALVAAADIVIEGSRPRALRQLGLDAGALAAGGKAWLSVTAYGRTGAQGEWIGFGDDVGIAAGLGRAMAVAWGSPGFAGDAIADLFAELAGALAVLAVWQDGGGPVDLAMHDVVRWAMAGARAEGAELARWQALAEADRAPLLPLRAPPGRAEAAGAGNRALADWLAAWRAEGISQPAPP